MITTPSSFASAANASVDGPGIASANPKSCGFSSRQKYCERNNSCRQITCAPRAAASRIFFSAIARFSSTVVEHFIWTSPTVNRSTMLKYYHFADEGFDADFLMEG